MICLPEMILAIVCIPTQTVFSPSRLRLVANLSGRDTVRVLFETEPEHEAGAKAGAGVAC